MAQGTNAEFGDAIKVVGTVAVSGFPTLIAEVIADPGNCTSGISTLSQEAFDNYS
jgi:hypothetical protein